MKGTFYENNWIPDKSGGLRKTKQEENKYCKRVKRTHVIFYPQPETYAIKTMKRCYHISLISKITKNNYLIWLNAQWRNEGGCRVPRWVTRFVLSLECHKNNPTLQKNRHWTTISAKGMREVREDANIDPTKCQFIGSRWSYQYKASQNEKYRYEREQKPKFASKKKLQMISKFL